MGTLINLGGAMTVRAFIVFILLMIAFGQAQADGGGISGRWLLTTRGDLLAYVLKVDKVKEKTSGGVEHYAYLGYVGAKYPQPIDVALTYTKGGSILSWSNGVERFEAKRDGDVFSGTISGRRGTFPVRLEKVPESDDLRGRWFNLPKSVPVSARIDMFYISSGDCVWCSGWEREKLTELTAFLKANGINLIVVKNDFFRSPIMANDYPQEHRWAFDQIGPTRGVPRFVLAIDRQVVLGTFGTGYYNQFEPILREIVARRGLSTVVSTK